MKSYLKSWVFPFDVVLTILTGGLWLLGIALRVTLKKK